MSPEGSQEKVSAYGLIPVCRGVYIHHFKINPPPHFLLPSLFWKLSQPLGQDKQNSKQIYCQLPIIIFIWTRKGFISPESFLNFLVNLCISPWLQKGFKFIVSRLLQIHLWIKKLNLFNCTHAPKQNSPRFLSLSPRQKGIAHFSRTAFSEDIFSRAERWKGEDCAVEKLPKLTRVLVSSFDKFHHLCNLYSLGLCFVVQ